MTRVRFQCTESTLGSAVIKTADDDTLGRGPAKKSHLPFKHSVFSKRQSVNVTDNIV